MCFSLIVTFLLVLGLVIISLQNSMPAVLALPKLMKKSLDVGSLNRETYKLKKRIVELGKGHVGGSQIE